jgi:type VI protein secretion system component VasK
MSTLEYVILFFVAFILAAIWVFCLVQIIARPDLNVGAKILWALAILVFPLIGAAAYIIYSSKRGPIDETQIWEEKSAEEIEEAAYRSSHMTASDRTSDRRLY